MDCPECSATILDVVAEVEPRAATIVNRAQCGHTLTAEQAGALWRSGLRWPLPRVDGISLATAERHRQVYEEGYTHEHDAAHDPNDLTWAAWCLLDAAAADSPHDQVPSMWPFGEERWKPDQTPLRRLTIAAAMIAAEIDRRLMEDRRGQGRRGHTGEAAGVARPSDGS